MTAMRVSVIGLGTIGGGIAGHLLDAGVDVSVFDLRDEAMAPFVERGARAAASVADAADGADAVLVAVLNDEQALDVALGDAGIVASAAAGTTLVIHSTVRPATVRTIGDGAASHGVNVLDGGVSTGGGDGKIAIWAGGDAETFESMRPVFEIYSHACEFMGPLGSGMGAKLARNLLNVGVLAAVFEGMRLAEAVGVELKAFNRVVKQSQGVNAGNLLLYMPTTHSIPESDVARAYYERLTGRSGAELLDEIAANAHLLEKDVVNAVATGADLGVDLAFGAEFEAMVRPFMLIPPREDDA